MKPLILFTLICLSIASLSAQTKLPLSPTPTLAELKSLFTATGKGEYDPFDVLHELGQRGAKVIPAASALVISETSAKADSVTRLVERRNRIYAAQSLELIGTTSAYSALLNAASSHSDPDTRGIALNIIANSYYNKTQQEGLTPDKELIRLLIKTADDTTRVAQLYKTTAHIAREGLKNWLGVDFGEPDTLGGGKKIKVGKDKQEVKLSDYRDAWLQQNFAKINWNKSKGKFQIK